MNSNQQRAKFLANAIADTVVFALRNLPDGKRCSSLDKLEYADLDISDGDLATVLSDPSLVARVQMALLDLVRRHKESLKEDIDLNAIIAEQCI